MGTAVRPETPSAGPWDAFADVDAFVDALLAELEAMASDGARPMRSGPKPPLAGAVLRKAVMAIWCVACSGERSDCYDIPFGTLCGLFARWTWLGLWRRLLDRLRRTWRLACGDAPEPSTAVIDSRSCRCAPSCFDRGLDGGKKIRGVALARRWRLRRPGAGRPRLPRRSLAKAGEVLGITVEATARGRGGQFVPAGSAGWSNGPSRG
jgi:hypothetical protein